MVPSTTVGKDKQQCECESVNASERRIGWTVKVGVSEGTIAKNKASFRCVLFFGCNASSYAEENALLIKKQASHSSRAI